MHISELATPVAVVDLDRLEANIARLQSYLDAHGIANRPHIKTHKIPEIAYMQLAAGAVGVTCQKIGEAQVMADAGIRDIFLPYNIVGATKLEMLMELAERSNLSVTADSQFTVDGLAHAAQSSGMTLPVLVEMDTGLKRCGVQTPQEAAALAFQIADSPGLKFGGLMTYPTSPTADLFVHETRALLNRAGLTAERVSGGGTPGMWQAHLHPEINEHRAGTYVYGDRYILQSGAMQLDECALSVITTVVSRPTAERGILDGGSKTFSSDVLGLEGFGLLLEYPNARLYTLSEEHGFVDFSECDSRPAVGVRVTVIPNHCCAVTNLFNEIVGVRGEQVEVVWPITARGRLQ